MVVFVLAATLFLGGCDGFSLWPSARTTTLSSLPATVNGTITFVESDYYAYPYYSSPNYQLDNIDAYNDIILATRDLIRRANIQIRATIYRTGTIFPGLTQTIVESTSSGSGVVFKVTDTDYYALTNYHVVDPDGYSAKYEILTFGETVAVMGELVAYDADLDLAVLKFTKTSQDQVTVLNITTRLYTRFTPGELVFAVGNPLSVDNNVTFGEFRNLESIANSPFKVIYHTATIHEGSSGGALVDFDGNLIGLNAWGTDTSDETSFAIPIYIIHVFLVNHGLT